MADTAHHGPLDQFAVSPIIELPRALGIDTSITNSALFMLLAVAATVVLFVFAMRKRATIPGRMQSLAEISYQFVHGIVGENAGKDGMKYFPLMFTLFLFIMFVNVIGLLPMSFAPTSQIIVTIGLGAFMFLAIVVIGIVKQGPVKFLKHFMPPGLPLWIAPLVLVIEIVSYLSRPLSLGIRLAANMTAGHTLIHVMAGFVAPLALFGFLPIVFLVFMTGFEFFVAILQAYVFTMLCSMYLGEALADHDHDHH
ncbi:MAG: F0F1 ATP synthase subunit A [Pseudomonadota bacterium]